MGTEKPAEYYDANLERVKIRYEDSPWRSVYDSVVEIINSTKNVGNIIDVGCGTGRCAEAIRRAGYNSYTGIDFSNERIKEAQAYVPSLFFKNIDVFSTEAKALYKKGNIFVITEFLEHVENDLEVLSFIPSGGLVILSVPNFDSAGHVRHFESPDAVMLRYSYLLSFDSEYSKTISKPSKPNKKTFIFKAFRK